MFAPKDIKAYVKRYILTNSNKLKNQCVIDVPAGSGYSSELLKQVGADVQAFDLFPEFFKVDDLICHKADISRSIPVDAGVADYVLFQEGIEHLADQLAALKEMNRLLKPGGKLLLTTPNYSSLRSRLSYLLLESEIVKLMPPNELDSLWFSDSQSESHDIYFGHIFLIGAQKLRLLGLLSGLRINKILRTKINLTSAALFVLFYPLIMLTAFRVYRRAMRKNTQIPIEHRRRIYSDVFKLAINPKILVYRHLFIEFEKFSELSDIKNSMIFGD